MFKYKKNDEVVVTLGKDRGKRGKVETILPQSDSVVVGGINIYKRHMKARGQGKPGGIVDLTKPLKTAKIAVVCPHCNKPTRIGFQQKGEEKIRVCRKCGGIL